MRALHALTLSVSVFCFGAMGAAPGGAESGGELVHAVRAQTWAVRGGTTTIRIAPEFRADRAPNAGGSATLSLPIRRDSTLTFSVANGSVEAVLDGRILHFGDLRLRDADRTHLVERLALAPTGTGDLRAPWIAGPGDALTLERMKAAFDPATGILGIECPELRITPALAEALGDPALAGRLAGAVSVRAKTEWIGGAMPAPTPDAAAPELPTQAALVDGPDMTFCQLYGMIHLTGSRLGDIVGLSVATTSWNIGNEDLMWFNIPDEEHPYIVMNVYRLMNDRFEQVGQSHIKHGFYALGSHQCGGAPCSFEPGHGPGDWLGTGCTDTYGAGLNGVQSGMGPKYEVNPWTGYWYYPGSHMSSGHTHDAIQHRIQVHDADLVPEDNPDAEYFVEGYYVILDDVECMNSASWKPVTVNAGPLGRYTFDMSGSSTYPNIGFAVDAWAGATQTLIAQEIPVQEFLSPDGRCVLSAKATPLGGDLWHYEYALLNVDMDRQAGAFSIPISPGTTISDVGFHAVEHHDEPFNTVDDDAVPIDNAPWDAVISSDSVTWSTTTNPVRWGTVYNFRFDADAPPDSTTVTVGLFRPGTPEALSAATVGPLVADCVADLDGSGDVGFSDVLAVLSQWGPCPGCAEDIDGDGTVGFADLLQVLSAWGPCS